MTSELRISEWGFSIPKELVRQLAVGLTALCLTGTLAMASDGSNIVTVTEDQNGKEVAVAEGGTLVVKLKTRLGTGYDWNLVKNEPSLLKQVGGVKTEGESGLDGGPQVDVFEFSAVKQGITDLDFAYQRPFSSDSEPSTVKPKKTFHIQVVITARPGGDGR